MNEDTKRLFMTLLMVILFWQVWAMFVPSPAPRDQAVRETPAAPVGPGPSPAARGPVPVVPAGPSAFPRTHEDGRTLDPLLLDRFQVVFDTRGGTIRELRLRGVMPEAGLGDEAADDPDQWLVLLDALEEDRLSFRLEGDDGWLGGDPAAEPWEATELENGVEFAWEDGRGIRLSKRITFPEGASHAEVVLRLENSNPDHPVAGFRRTLSFVPAAGLPGQESSGAYQGPVACVYRTTGVDKGSLETLTIPNWSHSWGGGGCACAGGGEPHPVNFPAPFGGREEVLFGGIYGQYYAVLAASSDEETRITRASVEPLVQAPTLPGGRSGRNAETHLGVQLTVPLPGAPAAEARLRVYMGPKSSEAFGSPPDRSWLFWPEAEDESYRGYAELLAEDHGRRIGAVTRVLVTLLRGFRSLVGNWGVAIILLTVLVRTVLFPLTRHQQVSMAAYQKKIAKVQPELDSIKKRYANNRQKLQEAQMKLFQEHGIRPPLMGCLPLFLQFPVFIGLFTALRTTYELRQAPFLGWIDDLSIPDALFTLPFSIPILGPHVNILPILMVGLWSIHQKSMPIPKSNDPQQEQMQKMMKYFPYIFGFMLYPYASGLSLYMCTSSALGIFEQKVIRKHFPVDAKQDS